MARSRWQEWIPAVMGTVVVIVVVVLLILVILHFRHNKPKSETRQVAQNITLIRPPPPLETPPPPPPEEKIEQPVEQPQQAPDQAPQQALGIDADAAAGSDSFGLASRPGGRDLIGTGTAPFRWYTDKVANRIRDCLSQIERVSKGGYKAGLGIDVGSDGSLTVADVLTSTGNRQKDEAIRDMKNCKLDEVKPVEMPHRVNLLLVSHG